MHAISSWNNNSNGDPHKYKPSSVTSAELLGKLNNF